MKTSRIVADVFKTAYAEDPTCMALVAANKTETVEVLFETMKAPVAVASILRSSQDALKEMDPSTVPAELEWNLESSMQITPDALDVSVVAQGDVLCINVGTGSLFFRLTERAKESLKNL